MALGQSLMKVSVFCALRGVRVFSCVQMYGGVLSGLLGDLVWRVILGLSLLGLVWRVWGNGCLCASWVFSCVGARARPAANMCFASCAISYKYHIYK